MIQGQKAKYYILGTVAAVLLGLVLIPRGGYKYTDHPLPADFDAFYQAKKAASSALGARPGTDEALIRRNPGKSKVAFLYIHGFGSCRGEGEEVMEKLADRFQANTYFVRLPGHGTNWEDHAKATATQYLDEAEEAIRMMPLLGDRVVVVGTSMGALLGAHLAATHPDKVGGLILISPFFEFAATANRIGHFPGGIKLASLIMGNVRDSSGAVGWERGWESCWYAKQYLSSVQSLIDVNHQVAQSHVLGRVKAPVLMLYYFKDEAHQDGDASVKAMLEGFAKIGGKEASPLNRATAVEDGDHVLFSSYRRTDKALILKETGRFLDDVQKLSVEKAGAKR